MLALAVAVLAVGEFGVAAVRAGQYRQRIGLYEGALMVALALVSSPWLVPAAAVAVGLARASAYLAATRPGLARPGFAATSVQRPRWRADGPWFAVALTTTTVAIAVLVSESALRAVQAQPTAELSGTDVMAITAGTVVGGLVRSVLVLVAAATRNGPGRFVAGGGALGVGRLLAVALVANTGLGVTVVVLAAYSPLTLLVTPAVAGGLVVVYRRRGTATENHQAWLQVDRLVTDLASLDLASLDLAGLSEQAVADLVQSRVQAMLGAEAVRLRLDPKVPALAAGDDDLDLRGQIVSTVQAGHSDQVDHSDRAEQNSVAPARSGVPRRARRTEAVHAPVSWAGQFLGRLDVQFDSSRRWGSGDELRLRTVAQTAAAALALARLQERNKREAELAAYAAHHDALTGLGNRRLLVSRAAALLAAAPDSGLALLLLDLDRFKDVNDTLGHATGDQLLQAVAETLRRGVRQGDLVARVDGDEFAVLVTGIASPAQAEAVAAELVDLLCRSVEVGGTPLAVEVSVGVACHPHDGANIDDLLQHADIAMYQAKQSHPRWRRYVPDDRAARLERLELVAELRGAISGGELVLNYQPQLELRTGKVKAVEALVRWNHPRRGLVTPTTFIPAVEQSGLIQPFTFAVLDQALRACAGWRADGFDVAVSVNLSARNLMNTELPGEVAKLLVTRGVPASSLTLEITETARIMDVASALRLLRELQELGVRVAADDFGTGYSSMALIQERVLDEVKIDRSFVRRLLVEQGDAAIVAATVQLAHAHGLTVVAEGVESAALLDALTDLRCDQVQGLHIGPAMPLAELTSWLGGAERAPRRAVGDTVRIFPGPHRRPPATP